MKKYPRFLKIGNWLFMHIKPNPFKQNDGPVGGSIPENIYCVLHSFRSVSLSDDLRTYEGLIEKGAIEPTDEELLKLVKY